MKIKINDAQKLLAIYGNISLGKLVQKLKTERPYKCPKCSGKGHNIVTRNTYPSGLPDSGWVEKLEDFEVECDVCNGHGYTKVELKADIQITGYSPKP